MGRTMRRISAKRNQRSDRINQLGVFLGQTIPTSLTSAGFSTANVTATPNLPPAELTSFGSTLPTYASTSADPSLATNATKLPVPGFAGFNTTATHHNSTAELTSFGSTLPTYASTSADPSLATNATKLPNTVPGFNTTAPHLNGTTGEELIRNLTLQTSTLETPETTRTATIGPFVCNISPSVAYEVEHLTKKHKMLSEYDFGHSNALLNRIPYYPEIEFLENQFGNIYYEFDDILKPLDHNSTDKLSSERPLEFGARVEDAMDNNGDLTPAQQECLMIQNKKAVSDWYAEYVGRALQKIHVPWAVFRMKFPRELASTLIGIQSYAKAIQTCDELKWKNLTPADVTRILLTSLRRELGITLRFIEWAVKYRKHRYHNDFEDSVRVRARAFHHKAMGQAELLRLREMLTQKSENGKIASADDPYVVVFPLSLTKPNGPSTQSTESMLNSVDPYRAHKPMVDDSKFTDSAPEYLRGDRLSTVRDALKEFTEWSASPDRKVGDTLQCTNDTTKFIVERPVNGLDTYSFHGETAAGENLDLTLIRVRESDDDITTFIDRQPVSNWTAPIRGMFKVSALFPNLTLENRHNALGEPTNQIEDIFLAFDHVEMRPENLDPHYTGDIFTYILSVMHDAYDKLLNNICVGKFTLQNLMGFRENGKIAFKSVITREERHGVSPNLGLYEWLDVVRRHLDHWNDAARVFEDTWLVRVRHFAAFQYIVLEMEYPELGAIPPYDYLIKLLHDGIAKLERETNETIPSPWFRAIPQPKTRLLIPTWRPPTTTPTTTPAIQNMKQAAPRANDAPSLVNKLSAGLMAGALAATLFMRPAAV